MFGAHFVIGTFSQVSVMEKWAPFLVFLPYQDTVVV